MSQAISVLLSIRPDDATRAGTVPDGTDARRVLQLTLGAIWLLDGVLQLQGYFFTKSFGSQMIGPAATGTPALLAGPITWSGTEIAHHAVLADSVFALVQITLGLGMAWRPTLKVALAGSVAWALGVWWVGEGFGGVFSGTAHTVNGAPGAAIVYAVLAVLLWPLDGIAPAAGPFLAARAVGAPVARAIWVGLWGLIACFAVAGANSSPNGLRDLINSGSSGEPGWIVALDRSAAGLVAQRGLLVSVALAVLLAIVAVGVYGSRRVANATLVLGIVLALGFWVVGENFGAVFTKNATDPNSGPLLILMGLAFWRGPESHARAKSEACAVARQGTGGVWSGVMPLCMGVAMLGMLFPGRSFDLVPAGVWVALFALFSAWFVCCSVLVAARRRSGAPEGSARPLTHCTTHLVMALAMLYMFLAASPSGDAAATRMAMDGGMASPHFAGLPLLFLLALVVSAVRELNVAPRRALAAVPGPATVTNTAMCLAMAYMLVVTL